MKKTNLSRGDYILWGYVALMFILISLFVIEVFNEIINALMILLIVFGVFGCLYIRSVKIETQIRDIRQKRSVENDNDKNNNV